MVRSITWPPGSQRSLVSWLDDNKGRQSPLLEDLEAGLDQLRDHLTSTHEEHEAFTESLSNAEVEKRLKYLWTSRLASLDLKPTDIQVLYERGSITLDWEKLSQRPIAKDYTERELEDLKRSSATSAASSLKSDGESDGTEEHDSGSAVPRNADDSSLGARQRDSEVESSVEDSIRSSKRTKRYDETANSTCEDQSQEERSTEVSSSAPKDQSQTQSDSLQVNDVANEAHISERALATSVAHDASALNSSSRQTVANARRSPPVNASPLPNEVMQLQIKMPMHLENQKEGADDCEFVWNDNFQRLTYGITASYSTPDLIENVMKGFLYNVGCAVGSYTHFLGISEEQPTILDPELRYPAECIALIGGILGYPHHGTEERAAKFLAFERSGTRLEHFMEAFVGMALVYWCLGAGLSESRYYADLGGGDVQRTFEKAFDTVMQAEFRRRLWIEYVSTNVTPRISSDAHQKAAKVQMYLDLFVPHERLRPYPERDENVVSLPESDPTRENVPEADRSILSNLDHEPLESVQFRNEIAQLFTKAIKWRVKLSMNLNESYWYLWPRFMDSYSSDKHRWPRDPNDGDGQQNRTAEQKRVMLGLSPVVLQQKKQTVDGEWSKWQMVCKGVVLPMS